MAPKVLIIGTVPYNVRSTSRAFDAYFHYWEKENLAQIFSNTKKPCKGHCGTLFQITDKRMLGAWLHKNRDTGVIYNYDDLDEAWENNDLEIGGGAAEKMYKIGRKHTPITHIIRGILWRKKFWCTEKLNSWLDEFKPECVFLSFSDDYFINEIALYVSERYGIPIVSCIGDDYYFNNQFSLNPFYHIYKKTYCRLIGKIFNATKGCVYISDKIRDKYNAEFSKDGETVFLTSTIKRKDFSKIDKEHPVITYFGNIQIGRNQSLCDIADVLGEINPDYRLEVYSNEQDETYTKILKNNPFIVLGGSVPYEQVQKRMSESDITVIVEGFAEEDINVARYALSTKGADALASGCAILTYGSSECGIIDYMQSTQASAVCTNKESLAEAIKQLFEDEEKQRLRYRRAIEVTNKNHTLERSCSIVKKIVEKAIERGV